MKLIFVFILTVYYLHRQVDGSQQTDDPNKPFWATRGRRSDFGGGRLLSNGRVDDDTISGKWAEDDYNNVMPETLYKDAMLRKKEQAASLLQSLFNALSSWDGEVIRKRGDPKTFDPNNPFWATRG